MTNLVLLYFCIGFVFNTFKNHSTTTEVLVNVVAWPWFVYKIIEEKINS